ncbi:MAG: sugar transferase [Dehalococcoidia bacterium]
MTARSGAFDIVGGLGLLAITAPILATAAVAVAFTSPGPVVFSQWRCGRGKRLFRCYKFRTMVVDAEQRLAQDPALLSRFRESWKLDDDPRVTPVGRWLRRLSIDELPQIINVLRGEMSIVGPRPVQPAEMEEKFGVWSVIVCLAKPGLTGLWQVSGRSQVRYRDRVALEVEYIRRRGFWYDLMLALRTIPCIITTRGAS